MKCGMISINKPHTDNIFSGDKGVEWRKKPLPEDLYYVYETKNKGGCGMVIGEMRIVGSKAVDTSKDLIVGMVTAGKVHPAALKKYANNGIVYANYIEDARRYDEPKPLWRFLKCGAPTEKELDEELCSYCEKTEWGERRCYSTPTGPVMCEGAFCSEAYDLYLDENFALKRPPQSWCHVEELR